jgi:hypothetical protein
LYVKRALPIHSVSSFFWGLVRRIRSLRILIGSASFGASFGAPSSLIRPPLDRFLRGLTVSAHTIEPGGKDSDDRQEVFGEVGLGSGLFVVEYHESCLLSLEQPLDELEAEVAETVAVGNGN